MRTAPAARPDPADAAAFAAVRDACRRKWPEWFYASVFLPRAKRDAACAVVAFCGMVREAIGAPEESLEGAAGLRHHPLGASNGNTGTLAAQGPGMATPGLSTGGACTTCGPTGSTDSRVALLAERLDELYDGRLELPRPESRSAAQHALHAFSQAVRSTQVPRQYFLDLAEGLRRDRSVSRYATWSSLERLCHQTAGSVALALSAVFGVTHSGAGDYALRLATAIRLTSILRDLKADRDRGVVYLPLEDLARFRYSERDLARGVVNENLRDVMRFEISRARGLLRDGAEGLCWLADDGSRLTVSTLAATSAALLDAIGRQGFDVLARPPVLSTGQKLRRLPLAWSLSRRRPGERLPNVFHAAT
jgi:phytoene synthase